MKRRIDETMEEVIETLKDLDDDTVFSLTPWGCLSEVLIDYGVDIDRITRKMGEHMVDDFMDLMVTHGHVRRAENE